MKAPDTRLKMPPWVPSLVKKEARRWYEDNIEAGWTAEAAMIIRLATDDRMKQVWEERCIQASPEGARALFSEAVFAASHCRVSSRAELENERTILMTMAERLRRDAISADYLNQAATYYEERAANFADAFRDPMTVDRDTGDPDARAFAIVLTAKCRELFGRPRHESVRIMASVAFEREIPLGGIKGWAAAKVG